MGIFGYQYKRIVLFLLEDLSFNPIRSWLFISHTTEKENTNS